LPESQSTFYLSLKSDQKMKKHLRAVLFLALFAGNFIHAQVTGVSTTAQNKTAIMEEFTGVRCTYCPDGHTVLVGLEASNPTNFVATSFHPNNSSLTAPYAGDEDLRRAYPAAFYATPYCGTSRFMPSAFINRRVWAGERIQGRGDWTTRVAEIIAEPSPANVGVLALYNEASKILTITVETYYTSAVTNQNELYVVISEDGITVNQQAGTSGAYVQDNVFREAVTAQWGDVLSPTTMGSMVTKTYTYDNSSTLYDMNNAAVMAYVEDFVTGELYTGSKVGVTMGTTAATPAQTLDVQVVPNPFAGATSLVYNLPSVQQVSYTIYDVQGKQLSQVNLGEQASGTHKVVVDAAQAQLPAGIYLLHLKVGEQTVVKRLVVDQN
jgi:hypothetical protein